MQSETPQDSPGSGGIGKLLSLANDPRAIQFLLLILVLDAVGILPQVMGYVRRSLLMGRKYNYGKKFKKNGRWVRYRYTNRRKSSKKLVSARKRR